MAPRFRARRRSSRLAPPSAAPRRAEPADEHVRAALPRLCPSPPAHGGGRRLTRDASCMRILFGGRPPTTLIGGRPYDVNWEDGKAHAPRPRGDVTTKLT